jgi:hypothetical protein
MHRRWLGVACSGIAFGTLACGRLGTAGGDAGLDATRSGAFDAPAPARLDASAGSVDAPTSAEAGIDAGASVLQFHNHINRDGTFVDPALTHAAASSMHLDTSFAGATPGHVYAQPLYIESGPAGRGTFFVATENNDVYALDEATGAVVWKRNVGTPAARTGAGCGQTSPIGVTGTPAIDLPTRTLFLDAAVAAQEDGPIATHQIHALSIDDGTERPGWPFDASTLQSPDGIAFQADAQNQRGALLIVGGVVYVAYGGHDGDCGIYHGWVVGVPVAGPAGVRAYATPCVGCGMWAPGGPSSDGTSIYVTTGNGTTGNQAWQGNEAVLRLGPGPTFSGQPADYWAPSDWPALDNRDADMSGTGPLVVDAPALTPSRLVIALGKDGFAHILARDNLGGLGAQPVIETQVDSLAVIGSAAWFSVPSGTYFVVRGYYGGFPIGCPPGTPGDIGAIKLDPASATGLTAAWCAMNLGEGSPIVTTTDGVHDPIVWTAGAENSERLHAWDAETGALLFDGGGVGDAMSGLRRFTTLIAVHGRVFAGADDRLYAFAP